LITGVVSMLIGFILGKKYSRKQYKTKDTK
jgi:uncharacterized protein YneF (UPF0154 family)